jgi:hypothetical protein
LASLSKADRSEDQAIEYRGKQSGHGTAIALRASAMVNHTPTTAPQIKVLQLLSNKLPADGTALPDRPSGHRHIPRQL